MIDSDPRLSSAGTSLTATGRIIRRPTRSSSPSPPQTIRLPAVTRTDDELMEAGAILKEFPDDFGMLLFTLRRAVRTWAETPPKLRGEMFAAEGREDCHRALRRIRIPCGLESAIATLVTVLDGPPEHPTGPLSTASLRIARWAFEGGRLGTALAYAHLCYRLGPQRGMAAVEVLRVRLRMEGSDGTDDLVRLAVRLGRSETPVTAAAAAHCEVGDHHLRTGDTARAEACYGESLRIAQQLRDREGEARARRRLAQAERGRASDEEAELRWAERAAREPHRREEVLEAVRQIAASASNPTVALRAERILRAVRRGTVTGS